MYPSGTSQKIEPRLSPRIKRWFWGGVIFCCLGVAAFFVLRKSPQSVVTARVERRLFRETLRSDGYLRSKDRRSVTAYAEGDIRRVRPKVGDVLRKGDLITELAWDRDYEPLRAPMDGVVSKVFRESAGPVHRGDPLLELVDPTKLEVVAELLTADALRVPLGARIRFLEMAEQGSGQGESQGTASPIFSGTPSLPNREARVTRVSRAGFVKVSALGVEEERTEVVGELLGWSPDEQQKRGHLFHVDLEFELSRIPEALVLPIGALLKSGGSWFVFRVQDGKAVRTPVQLRAQGEEAVALATELPLQTEVILYPSQRLREGDRVASLR